MESLQFAPFRSFVSPTFWHKLAEIKLEAGLADDPRPVTAFYTNQSAQSCLMELDYSAFASHFRAPLNCHAAAGTIHNMNTIEAFKACDKKELLAAQGRQLLEDIRTGRAFADPGLLTRFIVISYADLKSFTYYYWFCFPCPLTTQLSCERLPERRISAIPAVKHLAATIAKVPHAEQQFFVLKLDQPAAHCTLAEIFGGAELPEVVANPSGYFFCFADASAYEHPSWHMRTYLALIIYKCPELVGKRLQFIGVRYDKQMNPDGSRLWHVVQKDPIDADALKFVGWELNDADALRPRMVSMRDSMDSKRLAETSIDLNLRLMKWRLVPDLNLAILNETKCLLFGAGTLGCAVARNLLAWGFRHVTFIDNGKVSHSNPVRQSLYTHADAAAGNAMKATVAAARLKEINPNAVSAGHVITVPMPGHTIGQNMIAQTKLELEEIRALVAGHDVIFLLTDSRESRWLPTLLGAAYNKIVMNAALGFDSYLVMRHGMSGAPSGAGDATAAPKACSVDLGDLKCVAGADLGCYFCNDVTAPGNSMKDRTLDQQCTVTRPGVSNIAGSYAVELLVALLQHPQRAGAPAFYAATGRAAEVRIPEGLLGIIPHSIRGMLSSYENVTPATQKFQQCIACSAKILEEFSQNGDDFLLRVFESGKYLEDITGISQYHALASEIIDFEDSDLECASD